jgi:sulfite reductase (NADPH) flavoprotein alpha-component
MSSDNKPKQAYGLNHPFHARLIENRLLTRPGSAKETRHLAVDLTGSGLTYTCGDSLGVFPTNRPEDVEAMLQALQASGEEPLQMPKEDEPIPLRQALAERLYYLAEPSRNLLQALHDHAGNAAEKKILAELLQPERSEELKTYLSERHAVDVLEEFPATRLPLELLPKVFKKLLPRLYSISSAPSVYPEQVHLTIAAVRYETLGKVRVGVGSTFSIDRVPLGEPVLPVFIAPSPFALPEDDACPLIMIGPGTGVAPFRSFLMERSARKASGHNWLFFGEQHRATDFLYEGEIQEWFKMGVLNRLDLAWSRDQEEKIYVQHKLWQQKDAFWEWWERGARLYICGDKARMAHDVEQTFVKIAIEKGAVDDDPAAIRAWIKSIKKERRYQLDVY